MGVVDGIALITYPIWGIALLLLFCWKLRTTGNMPTRILAALVTAVVGTILFTPGYAGTNTFVIVMPWEAALFDSGHHVFKWPLAAFVFVLSFVANLLMSRAELTPRKR